MEVHKYLYMPYNVNGDTKSLSSSSSQSPRHGMNVIVLKFDDLTQTWECQDPFKRVFEIVCMEGCSSL